MNQANMKNRQWVLKARPKGAVSASCFEITEAAVPEIKDGQVLIKLTHVAFEPAMKGWIEERESYVTPVAIGEVMRASGAGEIVDSKNPDFKKGDLVSGMFGWQEFAAMDPAGALLPVQKLAPGVTPEMALSVLGITGLTAYFGMLDVGKPQKGDVVLVSGAAGATGSIAGQIAKIQGCTVIGIAGGKDKCDWLVKEAGFDAAIDYKSEDVGKRIKELCPKGYNIFYDNVGGKILEAALDNNAPGARIVICGGISGYNTRGTADAQPGPANYMNIVIRPSTMQGFLLGQFSGKFGQALKDLSTWVKEGKLHFAVDVQDGFENIRTTFLRLFEGKNLGKQLCKIG